MSFVWRRRILREEENARRQATEAIYARHYDLRVGARTQHHSTISVPRLFGNSQVPCAYSPDACHFWR